MECPGKGQFFTVDCFPFNATCNNPNPPSLCDAPRCVCPMGEVLDEEINACVKIEDCCKYFNDLEYAWERQRREYSFWYCNLVWHKKHSE